MNIFTMRKICFSALLLGAGLVANAQAHRDSSIAFFRRFSVGLGYAVPYPDTEPLFTDLGTFMPPTTEQVQALWRNAFARGTVPGLRNDAFPARVGYSATDRIDISLGFWKRSSGWEASPPRYYDMRMSRFFGTILYRAPIPESKRLRPVTGISFAYDERSHKGIFNQYFFQDYVSCMTRSSMASVVLGAHLAAGHLLFCAEVSFVMAARIQTAYSGKWGAGEYIHWMGPGESIKYGYACGPITLHANYTF